METIKAEPMSDVEWENGNSDLAIKEEDESDGEGYCYESEPEIPIEFLKTENELEESTGDNLFACAECGYKTPLRSRLTTHMRTHTGEKPFACTMCNFKTATKVRLTAHIRTHTGLKPFACTMCDYKAVRKNELTKHIRTHTDNNGKTGRRRKDFEYEAQTQDILGKRPNVKPVLILSEDTEEVIMLRLNPPAADPGSSVHPCLPKDSSSREDEDETYTQPKRKMRKTSAHVKEEARKDGKLYLEMPEVWSRKLEVESRLATAREKSIELREKENELEEKKLKLLETLIEKLE